MKIHQLTDHELHVIGDAFQRYADFCGKEQETALTNLGSEHWREHAETVLELDARFTAAAAVVCVHLPQLAVDKYGDVVPAEDLRS